VPAGCSECALLSVLLVKHGADDTPGRPIFEHVAKQIGQSLVFEHRPGTGGTLGMVRVAKAAEAGPIAV
jgi:tripartite-type tricarboxylate transporter receptor subunit TctC